MSGPQPPAVPLSEEERQALLTMIRAHKTPQHLSFRAQIILLLAEGLPAPDRGTPPRHDTHHGPALAPPLAQTPRVYRRGTLTRRPAPVHPWRLSQWRRQRR